jgi:hypothetical protein
MIAHELETPIAAVRKLNEVLSAGGEDPGVRAYATAATEGELDALTNLVRDVRAVAAVEREGFGIEARRVPLEKLLKDAESVREHPSWRSPPRVGARRGPPGGDPGSRRPQARRAGVAQPALERRQILTRWYAHRAPRDRLGGAGQDRGRRPRPGHPPRRRAPSLREVRARPLPGKRHDFGRGLGLYVSQRIVQSHGFELTVRTGPGEGSVFGFDLEVVR